jgi:hypothetical protein
VLLAIPLARRAGQVQLPTNARPVLQGLC